MPVPVWILASGILMSVIALVGSVTRLARYLGCLPAHNPYGPRKKEEGGALLHKSERNEPLAIVQSGLRGVAVGHA